MNNGKKFYLCPKSSKDPKKNVGSCGYFAWKEDKCIASKKAKEDLECGSSKKPTNEEASTSSRSKEKSSQIRLKLEVEALASKRYSEFCETMLLQLDDIEKESD